MVVLLVSRTHLKGWTRMHLKLGEAQICKNRFKLTFLGCIWKQRLVSSASTDKITVLRAKCIMGSKPRPVPLLPNQTLIRPSSGLGGGRVESNGCAGQVAVVSPWE